MKKYSDFMRFKWLANGCENFDEIIEALTESISYIKYLQALGCEISQNADDDYIYFSIPKKFIKTYADDRGCCIEEFLDSDDEE